jgi:hypothetical protein
MHGDLLAGRRRIAGADEEVLDDQLVHEYPLNL